MTNTVTPTTRGGIAADLRRYADTADRTGQHATALDLRERADALDAR